MAVVVTKASNLLSTEDLSADHVSNQTRAQAHSSTLMLSYRVGCCVGWVGLGGVGWWVGWWVSVKFDGPIVSSSYSNYMY